MELLETSLGSQQAITLFEGERYSFVNRDHLYLLLFAISDELQSTIFL